MKLVIKILFFVFLTTGLCGQSKTDELFSTIGQIRSLTDLTSQRDKLKLSKEHSDSLNLDIVQTNWTIKKGKKETSTKLLTLSLGDKIFYSEFYQLRLNNDFESCYDKKLYITVDSSLLRSLNKSQNLKYKSDIDFDQLTRLPNRSIFGFACSDVGTMPHDGIMMKDLVNKSDTTELKKWLVSINPVRQAYAYVGLKRLQVSDSITLTKETQRVLDELESNCKVVVSSCSGCFFWEYSPMCLQLTSNQAKDFINWRKTE